MVSIDSHHGISIIVPAWNEERTISDCLSGLLNQRFSGSMQIVIVANGCHDSTVKRAQLYERLFKDKNILFDLVETEINSKTHAINMGEIKALYDKKVYLDADVTLSANAIQVISQALSVNTPLMVSPKVIFSTPKSFLSRCHLYVFKNFPPMLDDVVGMGCYAVNTKGRLLWEKMPQLLADDAYVRSFFLRNERLLLSNIYFRTSFPEYGKLLSVLERWHRGNMELNKFDRVVPDEGLFRRRLHALIERPILIVFFPIYLINNLLAKSCAKINLHRKKDISWIRER